MLRGVLQGVELRGTDDQMKAYNAILSGWWVVLRGDEIAIVGNISSDQQGRWPDDRCIITSRVTTPLKQIRPSAIIRTRNSRYLLSLDVCSEPPESFRQYWARIED